MTWGASHGEHKKFCGICIQDGIVTPNIDVWANTPISHAHVVNLQSPEWREVGLKKSWLVVSFEPHQCDQYLHLWNTDVDVYTPLIPLHQTFHPLSNKGALSNIWMNVWGLLFTHPRRVSPVWCWVSDGQFALCGTSSVSLLSGVCSSRVVVVHLAHFACTTVQRGVPSVGTMKKVTFGTGLMNILSTGFSWDRKGCPQQPGTSLCMVPPPTSPSPSSSTCRCQL